MGCGCGNNVVKKSDFLEDGDEKQTIYKGYTIKHLLEVKPAELWKAKIILTTTIPGTDFKNTESTTVKFAKALKAITHHLETAEQKAIIYIDAIETDTDDNGDDGEIPGCTDSTATNYDESATQDDGSCEDTQQEDSANMVSYGVVAVTALSVSVLSYFLWNK